MPATTKNVFLDTEIFDRHNLDVFSPHFKRLIRLAEAEELRLILTDVSEKERERGTGALIGRIVGSR